MSRPTWGIPPAGAPAPGEPPEPPSACPACRSSAISTTAKSPDATSYWRCDKCGEIWNAGRRDGERGGGVSGWRTAR